MSKCESGISCLENALILGIDISNSSKFDTIGTATFCNTDGCKRVFDNIGEEQHGICAISRVEPDEGFADLETVLSEPGLRTTQDIILASGQMAVRVSLAGGVCAIDTERYHAAQSRYDEAEQSLYIPTSYHHKQRGEA